MNRRRWSWRSSTSSTWRVWEKLLGDEFLAELPNRIETDELGQIIMLPPPAPEHGRGQVNIGFLLKTLMKGGEAISECPVSTSGGVKGADVVWISDGAVGAAARPGLPDGAARDLH